MNIKVIKQFNKVNLKLNNSHNEHHFGKPICLQNNDGSHISKKIPNK